MESAWKSWAFKPKFYNFDDCKSSVFRYIGSERLQSLTNLWESTFHKPKFFNNCNVFKSYWIWVTAIFNQSLLLYVDVALRVGQVGSIEIAVQTGQLDCGSGWVYLYFSNKFFFFSNYKNKSMITCLERMNKIN